MTDADLDRLAGEIRQLIIETVDANGGHLASNLGVVEITLALHRVLDSPRDKIVWDTSNQTYPHKLVTGRAADFRTLRKPGGLSGFAAREESTHDVMGAGHAGTGVSAGVGIAVAGQLRGETSATVAVIGDGSFTVGRVFEALNQAGDLGLPFVVLLNDNGMSISPNVGALSRNMGRGRETWQPDDPEARARFTATQMASQPTEPYANAADFCAAFGFEYVGPVDGHDRPELESVLREAVDRRRPVLVHAFTRKGKGLPEAESDPVTLHQPGTAQAVGAANATSYSKVLARTLTDLAREDERIVAISAAMCEGTALADMQRELPDRVFDVGIAEGHAVAMAAGLATQGLRPVVCIYSTFLQRAFDQIVHDVAIQNLPVILGVDRAGIVGDDGRTHHGVLDLAYLARDSQFRGGGAEGRERIAPPVSHRAGQRPAVRDPLFARIGGRRSAFGAAPRSADWPGRDAARRLGHCAAGSWLGRCTGPGSRRPVGTAWRTCRRRERTLRQAAGSGPDLRACCPHPLCGHGRRPQPHGRIRKRGGRATGRQRPGRRAGSPGRDAGYVPRARAG